MMIESDTEAKSDDELGQCPFCGGEATHQRAGLSRYMIYWIECSSCGACTRSFCHSQQEAVSRWNHCNYHRQKAECYDAMVEEYVKARGEASELRGMLDAVITRAQCKLTEGYYPAYCAGFNSAMQETIRIAKGEKL